MALIKTGNIGGSARGGVDYELYCDQTGGSGNRRDVDVCLKLRLAGNRDWNYASSFGYAAQWQAVAHNVTTGWGHVKGTEFWYSPEGWREFHHRFGIDVGTTNSVDITVGFNLDSLIDNQWDAQVRGTFRVGSTNQAPTMSGTISTFYRIGDNGSWNLITREGAGAENSIKIPETATHIRCDWLAGNDDKGESNLTYKLWNQQNDGAWSIIYQGNAKSYIHTINAGNEGRSYDYYVTATDRDGATSSPNIDTLQFIKNVFTGASITSISNIAYNSTYVDVSWNNPSNTNGTENFIFALTCDGITIHNNETKSTSRSMRVHIATSARTDGAAYILKNDLINKFSNSSYKGTLNFTLTSMNTYGTKKTNSKGSSVNLQSTPGAVPSCSLDLANSTAYVTLASNNSKYIIPDGSKNVKLVWTKATGGIGEAITYDIYVAYGSGTWTLIKSDIPQNTLSYLHVIPKQSASVSVKYRITSKTSYGLSSSRDTSTYTLHYYNTPSLVVGAMNRTASSASLKVNINVNTSLSSAIAISGTWACYNKGTTTNPVSQGNLATNIGEQTINISNLKEMDQYDLKITYKDNSGFSSNVTHPTINIGQTKSVFFVNKYGIGVNGEKASSNHSLSVIGSAYLTGGIKFSDKAGLDCNTYKTDEFWVNRTGNNSPNRPTNYCTVFNIGADYKSNFQLASSYDSTPGFWVRGRHDTSGNYHSWARVYTTQFKPTPADIGAAPTSVGGNITIHADSDSSTTSEYLALKAGHNILQITSSGGGATVTKGQDKLTFNGNIVYHAGRKPTPADIGALSSSGGTLTGDLVINNNKRLKINGGSTNLEIAIGGNDVFFKNTKSDSYLQFHNNGNLYINSLLIGTQDYPIIGSDTNRWFSRIAPVLADGVIEIGRFIDFHRAYSDGADYTARFDANGNGIWCSTSISQGSDRELKENIKYLDDEPALLTTEEENSSTLFKDFIKDFKFATYNYKGSEGRCFGFIAQDIAEHPVSKLLLQEHEMDIINKKTREIEGTETTLAFNLADYTSVVAKALQEEIISRDIEIEKLEARIAKLENKSMEEINNE